MNLLTIATDRDLWTDAAMFAGFYFWLGLMWHCLTR